MKENYHLIYVILFLKGAWFTTNLEKTKESENKLSKSILKSRIIQGVIFVLLIVFSILRENSKVVKTIAEGWLSYTSVEYNNTFVPFIIIGVFGSLISYINGKEIEKIYGYNTVVDTKLPDGV